MNLMNYDEIFENYSVIKEYNYEDNFIQNNVKSDLEIKNEEIEQIYMNKTNNTTFDNTNNVQETKKKEKFKNEIINNKKPKRGRKKKNIAIINDNETKRGKFAKDNIARKIKNKFYNKFFVKYINKKIFSDFGYQIYLVRPFSYDLVTDVSIEFNLDLFNSPIKNLLNQKNSIKHKRVGLYENKRILRNLEKNPDFIEFLNISVNEIYSLFINDNYKEIISNDFNIDKEEIDFENITGTIEDLRKQGYKEKYIERFKYFAYNINSVFDKSKKRKQKKLKININSNKN